MCWKQCAESAAGEEMKPFLARIKNKIDKASVVSFDVFDTLLLRPYMNPKDLFTHLERIENMNCFANARIYAEQKARKKAPQQEDIPFDDIYKEIDPHFLPMKEKELQWEKQVLRANPEMLQVFEYAKQQGKRIIIVSDMYLSSAFVNEVLTKNGITGYEKIYMSSEYNQTKHSGNLYKAVLDELKISGREILHIGDNKKSDAKMAAKAGLNAVLYEQVVRQYLNSNARMCRFLTKADSSDLDVSILTALLAWRWQKIQLGLIHPSYWEEFGYEYTGPVAYGFCRFIERKAAEHKIDHLLFVARDGYTLQKVFQTFNNTVKTSYVYASRYLKWIYLLQYHIRWSNKSQGKIVIDYYKERDETLKKEYEQTDFTKVSADAFIETHRDRFDMLAEKECGHYRNYLNALIQNAEHLGVIDTGTIEATSQHLIEEVLNRKTTGLYWMLSETFAEGNVCCEAANFDGETFASGTNFDFIEFLCTAPELPVKHLLPDGQPVYETQLPKQEIENRKTLYQEVSNGGVQFAEEVMRTFGHDTFFRFQTLLHYCRCFMELPTREDIFRFRDILLFKNADKDSMPFLSLHIPFTDYLRHPLRCRKQIRKIPAAWRTAGQAALMNLFNPLRVRINRRKIEIRFLPHLRRCYFNVTLKFSDRFRWVFCIGQGDND